MSNENPIRFTLDDDTLVIVKEVTNSKYDFELILCNGSRKTFMWTYGASEIFIDKKGNKDARILEAVNKFTTIH